MPGRPAYRHGRIVWAYLRSQTGQREKHPAIILDRDEDITQPEAFDPRRSHDDNEVFVIGVSTKHKTYRDPYIQLPCHPQGHAVSGLKVDCGAIIGWYHRLSIPDDIIGFGKDVPRDVMVRIVNAVRDDLRRRLAKETEGSRLRQLLTEWFDG